MKSTDLTGTVRMAGETDTGIRVEIHLDDETMSLISPYGELGRWPLSGLGIAARVDGFHIKAEGEELVLSTNDDARFALAVGIRSSSSPRLVRQLAHARDDGTDVDQRLAPREPEIATSSPEPSTATPNRAPVAIAIMASAGALFLAAIQAYGSPLRVLGSLPLWPFWFLGCDCPGPRGLRLVQSDGPRSPAGGWWRLYRSARSDRIVRLDGRLVDFSWLGDGVFLGGTGTVLALLLWGVDLLNRGD